MNNLSWRGIRAFLLVAEYGSFTSAAEASGFSKANLSQLVSELERDLRVQLLHRTTRQLRLSEVGEGYYQRCKQATLSLDSAAEWATQSTDEINGVIRMNSVGGLIGEDIIGPLIVEFQQQYPSVQVHLDFSSIRVDLIENHYDLVLRMGQLPDSSLIARKIRSITTRYVASPRFLDTQPEISAPEDLKQVPVIYGSVNSWTMNKRNADERNKIAEQKTIQIDKGTKIISGKVMHHAALKGLGVTRLADIYCQSDIASGQLKEVLPEWAEETPISLVCPPNRYQLNRVKLLMDWLVKNFDVKYREYLSVK